MAADDKLTELQEAMNRYGEASVRNFRIVHPVGDRIVSGFASYLGKDAKTLGVPPEGAWRHNGGDYSDAKFSTYHSGFLQVGPIAMGLAVCIPHTKDDGEFWTRVVLEFLIEGGSLTVQVGDGVIIKNVPLEATGADLVPVYDAIFDYLKGMFLRPVDYAEAQRLGKIGFLDGQP